MPFRNAHLLKYRRLLGRGTRRENIYIGAVEEDSSGYPDCRKEFFDSFESRSAKLGTEGATGIEIKDPAHRDEEIADCKVKG